MTPDDLAAAGRSLFGDRHGWASDLARELGLNYDALRHMLAGRRGVPDGIAADVQSLLARQVVERAEALVDELVRKYGPPEAIVLKAHDAPGAEARHALAAALRKRGIKVKVR